MGQDRENLLYIDNGQPRLPGVRCALYDAPDGPINTEHFSFYKNAVAVAKLWISLEREVTSCQIPDMEVQAFLKNHQRALERVCCEESRGCFRRAGFRLAMAQYFERDWNKAELLFLLVTGGGENLMPESAALGLREFLMHHPSRGGQLQKLDYQRTLYYIQRHHRNETVNRTGKVKSWDWFNK
jgi:hypothetical protein